MNVAVPVPPITPQIPLTARTPVAFAGDRGDFFRLILRGSLLQVPTAGFYRFWLITDIRSFHRYVVGGHLPIPKVPFAPVPTGHKVPKAWLDSGIVKEANSFEQLAERIGVPPAQLRATADRFNELARNGHDDDFSRGDSVYDNYYGDPTLPNPNLHPLGKPPYYAFQIILGDLGTSGGLRTDEFARVLRDDDSIVKGLYAVGNASAAVMGRSYAGAGATIGPAMTFGYLAALDLAGSES